MMFAFTGAAGSYADLSSSDQTSESALFSFTTSHFFSCADLHKRFATSARYRGTAEVCQKSWFLVTNSRVRGAASCHQSHFQRRPIPCWPCVKEGGGVPACATLLSFAGTPPSFTQGLITRHTG